MQRRSREGLFDTLVNLPWQAGVIAGVVGFVAIRWGMPALFAAGGPIGEGVSKGLASGVLAPLAWVLLAMCWVAAALSLWRSGTRAKLLDTQASLDSIRTLSWSQIEQLVGEAYRRRGYRIDETGQGGADGGIDLLLTKDGSITLVQCKHWRSRQVGVSVVREMFGLMQHHGAAEGKIVCTGVFSADCFRFAVGKPIELVDGEALWSLVAGVRADTVLGPERSQPVAVRAAAVAPACPKCSSPMIERSNRATGQGFWGCQSYPSCRGTMPL
jgi:restriction system protein